MARRFLPLLAIALATSWPGQGAAEIKLGFANPLTGSLANSGVRNRTAVNLAVDDLNAAGGVLGQKVTLVVADDACGVAEAAAAAGKLIEAGVSAVVGHLCSHSSLIAAGIYETADVVMISPSSTHPRLTEEGRANVFRLNGRDDHQGRLAGEFLAEHWADGKLAILHDGSTYGEGLAAETRAHLRRLGAGEALYEQYSPGASDYAGVVGRLQKAGIEVVYVGGYGPDAGLILRTARERGLDLQLIGGDGVGMNEFWTVAGEAGEGTIFSSRPDVSRRPEAAQILARLDVEGRGRIAGLAPYAAVQVWAQAVERVGTPAFAAASEMLRRGRFATVLGRVSFDAKGDLDGAGWQWKVWSEGDHVPLAPGLLQQAEADDRPLAPSSGTRARFRSVRGFRAKLGPGLRRATPCPASPAGAGRNDDCTRSLGAGIG